MAEVTLSKEEFRALSADSRRRVIKLLKERRHTLSELAEKTGMSSPGMKEHLETLVAADLVRQIDEGRKWKYYSLTDKGNALAKGGQQSVVLVVLSLSAIALVGVLVLLMAALQPQGVLQAGEAVYQQQLAAGTAMEKTADATASAGIPASQIEYVSENEVSTIYTYIALAVLLAMSYGFLAAKYGGRANKE